MLFRGEVWLRRAFFGLAVFLAFTTPFALVENNTAFLRTAPLGYFALLGGSFILVIMSVRVYRSFSEEIHVLRTKGLQVESLAGFRQLRKNVIVSIFKTSIIFINAFIAFLLFVLLVDSVIKTSVIIMMFVVFSSLMSCASMIFLITIPHINFQPGSLSKYYKSPKVPLLLDNFITDTLRSTMDPAAQLRFDEWTSMVSALIKKSYAKEFSQKERVERAIETVLLLTYLKQVIPERGQQIFNTKIRHVIKPDGLYELKKGNGSRISLDVLDELIARAQKDRPGAFTIVDRLMTTLLERFEEFQYSDLWVETHLPERVGNYKKSLTLTVLISNLKKAKSERELTLLLSKEHEMVESYTLKIEPFTARKADFEHTLTSKEEKALDVIDYAIEVLHASEGFQFQIIPHTIGDHVVGLSINESNETVWGESLTFSAAHDYLSIATGSAAKLGAIGGALLSTLGLGISSILSIFGL